MDITVVIRSSGELTTQVCYNLVCKQVPKEQVFIINERPFSKAVIKNFNIGLRENRKWTLGLDADILLTENAISEMIKGFEELDENYYVYQGWIYDKFFRNYRSGGPHLYRTSLLEKAKEFIPEEGTNLRPESTTYKEMAKINYHYYNDIKCFGLHDFEQSYFAIYRKFFLHAHKHRIYLNTFLNSWKPYLLEDVDYLIALRGLTDGLLFKETVYVDTQFFKSKSEQLFKELKLVEKTENSNSIDVLELLNKIPNTEYWERIQKFPSNYIVDSQYLERINNYTPSLKRRFYKRIKLLLEKIVKQIDKLINNTL